MNGTYNIIPHSRARKYVFLYTFPPRQLKLLVGKFLFPGQKKNLRQADGCFINYKEKYILENLK